MTLRPLSTTLCALPPPTPQRPPSSREGDRPQAVEGSPAASPVEKVPFSNPTGFTRRPTPAVSCSPIAYRGFVVAPITLRPSQRNLTVSRSRTSPPRLLLSLGRGPPAGGGGRSSSSRPPYHPSRALLKPQTTPGCRVETLLVSMGVMGFLGDLRDDLEAERALWWLSEAEHPKRKGATLLRPLSAVNRNLPGNSHSRTSAPCDFQFFSCCFPHSGRMAPIPLDTPRPSGARAPPAGGGRSSSPTR